MKRPVPTGTIVARVTDSPVTISQEPTVPASHGEIDLDAMESDFVDVEQALTRLADGTYWTDEVTGAPIPDDVLVADPTARRAREG